MISDDPYYRRWPLPIIAAILMVSLLAAPFPDFIELLLGLPEGQVKVESRAMNTGRVSLARMD